MSSDSQTQIFASASLFLALAALSLLGSSWKSKTEIGDNYHQVRYQSTLKQSQNLVVHHGSCHCHKVHFKVRAPRILYAIDLPSKIRFPRLSASYQDFELGSDISVLSMYTVQQAENQNIGIYTFCSFCGMQILYSPSIDPVEIQVNLECLDSSNIENAHIAYHSAPETVAHPQNAEFNKRGLGHWTSPQKLLHDEAKDCQDTFNIDPFFKLKSQRDPETFLPDISHSLDLHEAFQIPAASVLARMPSVEENGMKPLNFSNEPRDSPETEVDSMSLTSQDSEQFHKGPTHRRHFHSFPFEEDSDSHFSGATDHHSRRLQHYLRRDTVQYSPMSSRRPSAGSPMRTQSDGVNFAMYQQVCRYMSRHRDSTDSDRAERDSPLPAKHSPQRRPVSVSEEYFSRR